jgi:hypothetical protein
VKPRDGTVLAALVVVGLAARPAEACSPAYRPVAFAHPDVSGRPVAMLEATVALSCTAAGTAATCVWEARYRLRAEGDGAASVRVGVEASSAATVTLDGAALSLVATPAPPRGYREGKMIVLGGPLPIETGRESTLVVRASFESAGSSDPCFEPAVRARHPIFAGAKRHRDHGFVVEDARGLASVPAAIVYSVSAPAGWRAGGLDTAFHELDPGSGELRLGPAPRDEVVRLWLAAPERVITNGGPFAGIGYRFGDGPRVRAGWEVAAPQGLLHAVAVEGGGGEVMIVPSSELASDAWMGAMTSLGVGVGVPVRVRPDPRVGGRGLVSLSLGPVTLFAHVDVLGGGGKAESSSGVFLQGGL